MDKMLGVMIDCSRNAVMNVESVKRFAETIKKMGYNTIMLYTEDTYEIDDNPCFGHLRGRYSKEELKELDAYVSNLGMELIPCIQTLAHLENMFKWNDEYDDVKDCDNILLIGEEKTYKLIDKMLKSCRECFKTNKIHIGMDEAYRVGTGEYQKRNGICDRFDVINSHLHKVCEMAKGYDFEPMIWSDMFCKLAMNIHSQYDVEENSSKILEKADLPENISLVYWDYYSLDYDRYKNNITANKMFNRPVYFAGGAWTWNSLAPRNKFSIDSTSVAFDACNNEKIDGVFLTMWGDDGGECSRFAVLPSLMYAAEMWRGNKDLESIKKKFFDIIGTSFDGMLLFDKMDEMIEGNNRNQCKFLLYNDPFLGIRDYMIKENDGEYFEELGKKIRDVKEKGDYENLFEYYAILCDVLKVKAPLGVKTRKAYKEKDFDKIKNIITEYDLAIEKIEAFHKFFMERWFEENKPHGFDVQDIRLGGLIQRLKSCKERLKLLVEGKISSIPELEEPVLDKINGKSNSWKFSVTVNNI